MKEIIFLVEESPEGGYEARALGYSIFSEATSPRFRRTGTCTPAGEVWLSHYTANRKPSAPEPQRQTYPPLDHPAA
jgi:hypothetical protein